MRIIEDVFAARLAYQRDRRTFDRLRSEADAAAAILATARRLATRFPGLDLPSLAARHDLQATAEREWAAARLRSSADTLLDAITFADAA